MRKGGDGRAVSLAAAPAREQDGARTTFQCFDETHSYTSPRLKEAHQTMMAGLPKRTLSDAWSLEISTAPEPGAGSVAEATMDYAQAVAEERVIEWWTNRRRQMTTASEGFDTAIRERMITHDGSKDLTRHLGNARRQDLPQRDEQGKALWLIRKSGLIRRTILTLRWSGS